MVAGGSSPGASTENAHTVEELRKLTPGKPDDLVFDTTNYKKRLKKACLKLGFAYLGWQCGQCGATKKAPQKERQECKVCRCPMHFGYIGMTTHGFRRSMIVYYRDCGIPDAIIMSMSGHTSLDVYRDYSVSDLQAQREGQRKAAAKSERVLSQHQTALPPAAAAD